MAAPLLLGAGEMLRLSTGSGGAELEVAGLTRDSPGVWIAVGTLEVAGVIVVFPALSALLHIFTRRAASLGHLAVGLLALANAVWSSKLFPRWTAATIAVAAVLTLVVDYGLPYLLLVVAWGWMGWKVLRMSSAEWERLRAPPPLAETRS